MRLPISILLIGIVLTGCAASAPYLNNASATDLQQIESRELPVDYETAFRATVAGLQQAGYVIATAEPISGVVTTTSKPGSIMRKAISFVVDVWGGNQTHIVSAQVQRVGSLVSRVRLKIIQEATASNGRRSELSDITELTDYRAAVSALLNSISSQLPKT